MPTVNELKEEAKKIDSLNGICAYLSKYHTALQVLKKRDAKEIVSEYQSIMNILQRRQDGFKAI